MWECKHTQEVPKALRSEAMSANACMRQGGQTMRMKLLNCRALALRRRVGSTALDVKVCSTAACM